MLEKNGKVKNSKELPTVDHISHLQQFYFTFIVGVFSANRIADCVLSTLYMSFLEKLDP